MEISFAGIEQAVEGLGYRSEKSPKYRLLQAVRSLYGDGATGSVQAIEIDTLIDMVWNLGGNKKAIRSKRKNFSSIKSSVNADLDAAWANDRNPEGITIGPQNTFIMSDAAKDKILSSFSGSVSLDGGNSLDRIAEALKIVTDYLSDLPEDVEDGQMSNLKSLIEGLSEKIKGGVAGEYELTEKKEQIDSTDEAIAEKIDDPDHSNLEDNGYVSEETQSKIDEVEEIVEDDLNGMEAVDDEDAEYEDIETLEGIEDDDMDIVEVYDEDEIQEIDDEFEEEADGDEDESEIEAVEDAEPEGVEGVAEDELVEIDEEDVIDEAEDILDEIEDESEIEDVEEAEPEEDEDVAEDDFVEVDEEDVIDEAEDILDEIEDESEIEAVEEAEPEAEEEMEEDELVEVDDDVIIDESEDDIEEIEDDAVLEEEQEVFEETPEDEYVELDEDADVVEELEDDDLIETVDEDDVVEAEDELEETDEGVDIEEDEGDSANDLGLPIDQLSDDAFDFDEFEPDEEQKRLLAERFDGYLGAMERYYNQYIIVPKGTYTVGADLEGEDVLPEQTVTLPDVYMGKYPVTNALFEIFIERTGYKTTAEKLGFGYVYQGRFRKTVDAATGLSRSVWNPSHTRKKVEGATWYQPLGPGSTLHQKRNHPVVQVSIHDARTFAAWTGKRLPTEMEWEAAARTRKGFTYPWGNEWRDDVSNVEKANISDTSPVDQLPQGDNDEGLADLLGNVMEWTSDECDPKYPVEKPTRYFVAKGGSWVSHGEIHLFDRARIESEFTSNILGFRCIAD